MDRTHLRDLEVSAIGLGCMGMSEYYGATDWERSTATIHHALASGRERCSTPPTSMGRATTRCSSAGPWRPAASAREQIQLATKFGIDRSGGDQARRLRGDAAYVQRSCEASLLRLGQEYIDLYYLHRPSNEVEIEETVGAMAELVTQGKVRHLGLSEVPADTLRRAHAVHPIAAVQSEYSIFQREVEEVTPTMAELGVGLVPYSPLGRGFLTGTITAADLSDGDFRANNPRFQGEAGESNARITAAVVEVAERLGVTAAQVALAWVYAPGPASGGRRRGDPRHHAPRADR